MSVKVRQITMVRPSEDTPRHTIWLSGIDMLIPTAYHSPLVFAYRPTPNHNSSNFFDPKIVKEALGRVLVPFYPMAGRLHEDEARASNIRLGIDCNSEGVPFIEAETSLSLSDLGDLRPNARLRELVIPKCDYSKGVSSFPLMMIQLMRFRCGGVILGYAVNHRLGDGASHLHFINSLARVARGLDLTVVPFFEREGHTTPRHPPRITFPHSEYEYDPPPLSDMSVEKAEATASRFQLSRDQIHTLRQKTSSQVVLNYRLTTYEVLAAHVWRSACRARGLAGGQETRLYMPVDGRSRLKNPPLPKGYNGNCIFFLTCFAEAGEITSRPLWQTANKIHETLMMAEDEEYLRSTIDYLGTHPNLTALVRDGRSVRCPNLSINFWGRGLPFAGADFGWGTPIFGGHGGITHEGQSFIVPHTNGDGGFSLNIKLFDRHVDLFEKHLYDFESLFSRM